VNKRTYRVGSRFMALKAVKSAIVPWPELLQETETMS
jgi:hypothetical protein